MRKSALIVHEAFSEHFRETLHYEILERLNDISPIDLFGCERAAIKGKRFESSVLKCYASDLEEIKRHPELYTTSDYYLTCATLNVVHYVHISYSGSTHNVANLESRFLAYIQNIIYGCADDSNDRIAWFLNIYRML